MKGILHLQQIEVECILGILPRERVLKQKVILNVEIETDFLVSFRDTTPLKTVDWTVLPHELSVLLEEGAFYLAETACIELARYILKKPNASATIVKLTKVEAGTGAQFVQAEFRATRDEINALQFT